MYIRGFKENTKTSLARGSFSWVYVDRDVGALQESVENINFLIDGSQYRNKLMFYVLACKVPEMWPKFMSWTWDYHRKAAPDGLSATCKKKNSKPCRGIRRWCDKPGTVLWSHSWSTAKKVDFERTGQIWCHSRHFTGPPSAGKCIFLAKSHDEIS